MFSPSLLAPFLPPDALSAAQLAQLDRYLELLLRWNQRINLTAVRAPDEIVTRHFGESLFAARHLFPDPARAAGPLADLGSGAGFPGLPIAIYAPALPVSLIESQQKKATFLKEAARALTLTHVNVFPGRAEDFRDPARIVTLRAVERFDEILPIAAGLLAPHLSPQVGAGGDFANDQRPSTNDGILALLIGSSQVPTSARLLPHFRWETPLPIPQSANRVLLLGRNRPSYGPDL
jgi:16S rRNA (guanine527-N7)-methyltransferase